MNESSTRIHLSFDVRRRILGVLAHDRTVDDMAETLGKTDARVQWHLQQMIDHGLVEIAGDGQHWHRTEAGTALLDNHTVKRDSRGFPDRIIDDFADALLELDAGLYGDDAVQASGEHRSRLSTAQANEFRDRLLALVGEYFAPGMGDRSGLKYGFHWMLTPIDLHPLAEQRDSR